MLSAMLTFADFSFGDALLTVLEVALFFAWLCLLFYIFADIFRSRDLSGVAKTLWVLALFILPWIGALIYLIARGGSMHERAEAAARHNEEAFRRYVRETAGTQGSGSLDELERLSALHSQGSLSDDEFARAKAQLLDRP